jgi:hypothetical protein
MVDVNMEDMSSINLDDLIADVVEIQTILQCNSIGEMIDVNEIYEKLEELAYMERGLRITCVATQLLHKLGVIDNPEVTPEECVFGFSQKGSEDSLAANSSCSDERSPASEESGSCATQTENGVPFSNDICTGCRKKDDGTVNCIDVPSTGILTLVNNENQNSQDCNIKIQQDSLQKFDAYDKTLMNEAELIHSILPHHDIGLICACLQAYEDKRVDNVIETFLKLDSESAVVQLPCTEVPVVSGNVEFISTADNGTPSCDENHDCDKYLQHNRSLEALPPNVVSPQETLADADLIHGNFNNSEITDEETCQETNRNVGSGLIQTCHSVHGVTEQAYKLEMEGQHSDREVHEGNIEVMPSALEEREELVDVTSSSVEQNASEGNSASITCSLHRDITRLTDAGSGDAVTDLTTSKPEENDVQLYISCNGQSTSVPDLQDEHSTYSVEGNFDPNMSCETNASPPSCSVSQIEQSQAVTDTSFLPFSPPDAGIVESNTVQEKHMELNGKGGEIGCIMPDFEMVLQDCNADGTGIFENKSQSGMLVEVQPECDVTVIAVAEEQFNAYEQSGTVVEENTHDRNVAKLQELFPDARMDYLVRISHESDSLTDMVNKVLECPEQQNDHVDDSITMAVPPVSALVPDSSASALAADPQTQGCRKKEITYEEFQSSLAHFDQDLLMSVWEEIGNNYGEVKEFIAQHKKETLTNDRYHLLLGLFPNADPAVLCESMKRIGDDEDAMRSFITQQFDETDGVKFPTLLAVLPDADPDYLHATYQSIGNDINSVKEFLLKALEEKDYPTREAYHKRQEMAALQRKYKKEFSIEDFIEMFPDPCKHFYEEDNNNGNELITHHGIAYLEARYRKIALDDIRSSFQNNKHNLTLTCRELDKWNGPVQPPREAYDCAVPNTEDIPVSFLQEVIVIFIIGMWIVFILK